MNSRVTSRHRQPKKLREYSSKFARETAERFFLISRKATCSVDANKVFRCGENFVTCEWWIFTICAGGRRRRRLRDSAHPRRRPVCPHGKFIPSPSRRNLRRAQTETTPCLHEIRLTIQRPRNGKQRSDSILTKTNPNFERI